MRCLIKCATFWFHRGDVLRGFFGRDGLQASVVTLDDEPPGWQQLGSPFPLLGSRLADQRLRVNRRDFLSQAKNLYDARLPGYGTLVEKY